MTPQGQPMPPPAGPQQTWFQKNWKWLLAVAIVVPLLCCGSAMVLTAVVGVQVANDPEVKKAVDEAVKEAQREAAKQDPGAARGDKPVVRVVDGDKVRVDCGQPGPGGVDCTMKRTGGEANVQACWDLEISCQNGGVMTGHACGKLAGTEQEGTVNMPVDSFADQDACDVPKAGEVKGLEVSVE